MASYDRAILVLGGRHYRSIGLGLGAQLESMEWRRPAAGTERELGGHRFRVFSTHRQGFRIRVSWGLAVDGCLDTVLHRLREMQADLRRIAV